MAARGVDSHPQRHPTDRGCEEKVIRDVAELDAVARVQDVRAGMCESGARRLHDRPAVENDSARQILGREDGRRRLILEVDDRGRARR